MLTNVAKYFHCNCADWTGAFYCVSNGARTNYPITIPFMRTSLADRWWTQYFMTLWQHETDQLIADSFISMSP
jgi:hypothetical protein